MKISAITAYRVELPVEGGGFQQSNGRVWRTLDSTIVRIDTDAGISGWGEACPFGPNYLPAFAGGVRASLELLAPALVGVDPCGALFVNELTLIPLTVLLQHPGHLQARRFAPPYRNPVDALAPVSSSFLCMTASSDCALPDLALQRSIRNVEIRRQSYCEQSDSSGPRSPCAKNRPYRHAMAIDWMGR